MGILIFPFLFIGFTAVMLEFRCDWKIGYTFPSYPDQIHPRAQWEWGLSYLEEGKEMPQWFPVQFCGMPRVGNLINVSDYYPPSRFYNWVKGYNLHSQSRRVVQVPKTLLGVLDVSFFTFLTILGQMIMSIPIFLLCIWCESEERYDELRRRDKGLAGG